MMKIEPFMMERWQSVHEHQVEINLSDSGVHPLSLRELLDNPGDVEAILNQRLVYTQTNGTTELRNAIAKLYDGATAENVQAVSGGAEANFITLWKLIEPGDEVVVMIPNYMQIVGLVRCLGGVVKEWRLKPDFDRRCWSVDLDELRNLITTRTKLIAICNPNNPTGARFEADVLDAISEVANACGAWVLSDEIYQGSEYDERETPTLWGRAERAIVTNSLSKSYGLPGLRLGWLVAPAEACEDLWAHHDYTTIAPGAISDTLATKVLKPPSRERLLARARKLLRDNLALVTEWLNDRADVLKYIPPVAGAMLWIRYDLPINSSELACRLLREKSVLVVPGDHFGMDGWMRIGFGGETAHIEAGLQRVQELLESIRCSAG